MILRILVLYLANALLWLVLVPPWQAPDEPKHLEYVRLLGGAESVVAFESEADAADPELQRAIIASMDEHHFWWYGSAPGYNPPEAGAGPPPPTRFADIWLYGTHTAFYRSSPAYYWLSSRLQPVGLEAGLYAARLLGVVLGALVVVFTAMAAKELFPERPIVRYGAPLVVALHPMFVFLQASVNSDVVVTALAALVFLLIARLFARGGSPARIGLLIAVTLLAALVKRTAAPLAGVVAGGLVLWLVSRARRPTQGLAAAGAAVGVAALVALSMLRSGAAVSDSWRNTALRYFFNEPDQPARIAAYLRTPEAGPVLVEYGAQMLRDLAGNFGWQVVAVPALLQWVLLGFGIVAAAGVLRIVASGGEPKWRRAALVVYAAAPIAIVVAASAFFLSYLFLAYPPPAQGRYLMLAAVPLAVLVAAGIGAWLPPAAERRSLFALAGAMLAYDAVALFGVVVPYFYR